MKIGDKITILKKNDMNLNYEAGDIGVIVEKDTSYIICKLSKNEYEIFFLIDEENSLFKKIKDKKKIG